MRLGRLAGPLVVLALLAGGGCGDGAASDPGTGGDTVRVAAASDLRFALEDVAAALAGADPPVDLQPVYGSSGTFFQQILNGAPYDVYLSADLSYPARLVDEGLAAAEDLFPYAVGRLVLWAPDGSEADVSRGLAALTDPAIGRVSIANPDHAPYGVAAAAAMRTAGVYEQVQGKLVTGENVAQAAEFAVSGNADVAVVALSLVLADGMAGGEYAEVPLASYPRLDQGGVVLAGAADPAAAARVREFLTGPDGVEILQRYGFFLPDEAG